MFLVILVTFSVITANAQRSYRDVFDPTNDDDSETLTNGKERTLHKQKCPADLKPAEVNTRCKNTVKSYNPKGNLIEINYSKGLRITRYTYDAKDRVVKYYDSNQKNRLLNLSITYDAAGKISAVKNVSGDSAYTVVFTAKEEKLKITRKNEYTDVIYFKKGIIQKVFNITNDNDTVYQQKYTYDTKNRITYTEGKKKDKEGVTVTKETNSYNKAGKLDKCISTDYPEGSPDDATVIEFIYTYNEKGILTKMDAKWEEGYARYDYILDAQNRLMRKNFYVNDIPNEFTNYIYTE